MGAEDHATASIVGSADGALASVAGALLTEGLAATAADHTTGLGVCSALAQSCHLGLHDLVHDIDVGLDAEDGIVSSHGLDVVACGIEDLDICHLCLLP